MKGVFRFTPEQSRMLSEAAYDRLINNLMKYGNKPGEKQKVALRKLIETLTAMAGSEISGRIAFPIPTGAGKTQSIVAFASTLVEQGYDDVGIIVCASKVEALCDLYRSLLNEGVPPEKLGLIHSYSYDKKRAEKYLSDRKELPKGYASLPRTENNQHRQILLATHQRIKGTGEVDGFNVYNGQARQLLIWDESLLVSESFSVPYVEMAKGLNYSNTPEAPKSRDQEQALSYLSKCKVIIDEEIARQKNDHDATPRELILPPLSSDMVKRYKNALEQDDAVDPLRTLLDMCQNPIRVLTDVEQGGGLITYKVVVPRELQNIVILDASHLIRDLAKIDSSITVADIDPEMVSYENVTVHQLLFPSGRNSMTKEFEKKRGDRLISREIIDVVREVPPGEGIIIFTHKQRGRLNIAKTLRSDLSDAGIDTEATIEVSIGQTSESSQGVSPKPRINVLTWGNETSISEYSYCQHVIFAGVLHRSYIDIGSAIAGQKDDLSTVLHNKHIREVMQSEVAHCVYQGMSRGSSRVIDNGTTRHMTAWLIHKQDIKHIIQQVMPGVCWQAWKPKHLPVSETKLSVLIERLKSEVSGISNEIKSMSISKLKKLSNMTDIPARSYSRALSMAIDQLSEWTISGRSIVRASSPFL